MLADLHQDIFASTPEREWTANDMAGLLALPKVYSQAVFLEGQPVGFSLVSIVIDVAEILTFGVVPDAQRQGVGALLLQDMIKCLPKHNVHEIFLEVREGNVKAQSLYRDFGFLLNGRRLNYYRLKDGNREDALVFKYKLNFGK